MGLMVRFWVVVVGLLGIGLLSTSAAGQSAEPLRVVIWFEEAAAPSLVERIRGQASDLQADLVLHRAPLPAGSRAERVSAARQLASRRRGNVVVWAERGGSGVLRVFIVDLAHDRALEREIGAKGARGDVSSATLESAALVVREALIAIAAGAPIGEQAPAPPPPSAPSSSPVPPVESTPTRPRPSWRAGVAWQSAWDGTALVGHTGPAVHMELQYRRLAAGATVGMGIPVRIDNDYGAIQLSRHHAGAWVGAETKLTERTSLVTGMRVGAHAYYRSTERAPSVAPDRDRLYVYPLLGPELRLRVRMANHAWMSIASGADVSSRSPDFGYQVDGKFVPVVHPWRIFPRIGLGAEFGSSW